MLPKKERLKRDEFNRFFSVGKRIHSPSLQLVYVPHEALHVSVVVSKKVSRAAVKRNKLRRRIYDIVRRHRMKENLKGVYIFLVKEGAREKTFAELREEVVNSLRKTQNIS